MSLQATNAEQLVLRRYVLGQLPPIEQDQVEDRFAAPAYFAQYQEIERDLLREYAAEAMPANEARLLERNYLVTSKRREQLVILKALMETQATQVANERVRPRLGWKLVPVLASIALVVAGIYWTRQHRSIRQEIALNRPPVPWQVVPSPHLYAYLEIPKSVSRSAAPSVVTPKQRAEREFREQRAAAESRLAALADLEMQRAEAQPPRALATLRGQGLAAAAEPTKVQAGELPLFVLTPGGRGQGNEAVVSMPSGSYWIRLGLRLEAVGYQQYTVAVETLDGTQVWRGDNLSLQVTGAQGGLVQVIVPSNLLHPGDYKVKLSAVAPDGAGEIVAGYSFRNRPASHMTGGGLPKGVYAARASSPGATRGTARAITRTPVQSYAHGANAGVNRPAPTAPAQAGKPGTNVKK